VIGTVNCISSHFLVNWGILSSEIVCTLWAPDFRKYVRQQKAHQSCSSPELQVLYETSVAVKVPVRLEIARTWHTTMSNINIINRDVLAAPFSTKNIIIPPLLSSSARNIPNRDILNHNSIRRISGRTAVEIILLNVDAVLRYIRNANVFVKDVRYEAGSVGVALDACAVLGVEDDGVGERNVCDVVV
jgi:hypothetical protein